MTQIFFRKISFPVAVAVVAVTLVLVFDHFYGRKKTQMERVGGTMNQCTCTQRLEK